MQIASGCRFRQGNCRSVQGFRKVPGFSNQPEGKCAPSSQTPTPIEGRCLQNSYNFRKDEGQSQWMSQCIRASRFLEARTGQVPSGMEGSHQAQQRSQTTSLHRQEPGSLPHPVQKGPNSLAMDNSTKQVKFLSVGYANCFSVKNKLAQLELVTITNNFDIVCFTETKLDNTFPDSLLSLSNNFSVVRKDRNKHGGGVAILISKSIRFLPIEIPSSLLSSEIAGVDIMAGGVSIRIVVGYHPSHHSKLDGMISCLEFLLSTRKNCVILGDFNMPHISWPSLTASDSHCKKCLSFVTKNGLTQHIASPTRLKPDNILDLCFTNTNILRDVRVGDLFSDHKLIHVTLSVKNRTKKLTKKVKLFRKADYASINYLLSNTDWVLRFSNLNADGMYEYLLSILHELIASYVPVKAINTLSKRHSAEILKLQKAMLNVWRKEGNSTNYKNISADLKVALIKEEKRVNDEKLTNGSVKDFFKFINSRYKDNQEIGTLKNDSGAPINCDSEKVELFSDSFSKVFTEDNNVQPHFDKRTEELVSSPDFEPYIIEHTLSKLTPKLNTTPDGIPALFLKNVCTAIALPLSIIFRESFRTSIVPTAWKTAIVKPLHKKGSRANPNNYRLISLTSSVGKVMEKLVRKQLTNYLNSNRLLSNCQYGFRSSMSTEAQLLSYQADILTNYICKKTTHSVYIDFKKAFDKVSLSKLKIKLRSYGIHDDFFNWLCAFLTNRTQRVCINNVFSSDRSVLSGVPQGSVLGPLLFLLFINDIGDAFESNYLLYADDLKLFSTNADCIKKDLVRLSVWCDNWQMGVAPEKCEVISFNHSKKHSNSASLNFSINDAIIPQTKIIRDLGIIFNSDLNFSNHLDVTLRKAHQRVNIFFNVLRHADFEIFIKCFKIYVRPLLEYGSTVFSPTSKEQVRLIESVQKTFIFQVFRKFNIPYISYFESIKHCDILSLEHRRIIIDLVFMYKILVSKEVRIYNDVHISLPRFSNNLRRHPYYIKSKLSNSTKNTCQFFTNRIISCWNKLPPHIFPSFPNSDVFRCNISFNFVEPFLILKHSNF
ncbi:hypothetical protein CRE_07824 [Caenorhabditis remanei]|uniref:Reverse transcriptase domain-containing protein n=1 Tax=Caenorhabditis remanei TaxID=31234 RepID=E3NEJ5_CAERE|nr:hypothetical protein CRE_07824 [Caenorhabditis remanei]